MSYIEKPRDSESPRSESATCWVQDGSAPGAGGVEPRGGDLLLLGLGETWWSIQRVFFWVANQTNGFNGSKSVLTLLKKKRVTSGFTKWKQLSPAMVWSCLKKIYWIQPGPGALKGPLAKHKVSSKLTERKIRKHHPVRWKLPLNVGS